MNSIPAASKALRTAPIVEARKFSPRSSLAIVSGDTPACLARSRVPQPSAVRAILHWIGFNSYHRYEFCLKNASSLAIVSLLRFIPALAHQREAQPQFGSGVWIMADSENSRTLPSITRRKLVYLPGALAVPAGMPFAAAAFDSSSPAGNTDPVLRRSATWPAHRHFLDLSDLCWNAVVAHYRKRLHPELRHFIEPSLTDLRAILADLVSMGGGLNALVRA
jgi:hypothetical protein